MATSICWCMFSTSWTHEWPVIEYFIVISSIRLPLNRNSSIACEMCEFLFWGTQLSDQQIRDLFDILLSNVHSNSIWNTFALESLLNTKLTGNKEDSNRHRTFLHNYFLKKKGLRCFVLLREKKFYDAKERWNLFIPKDIIKSEIEPI